MLLCLYDVMSCDHTMRVVTPYAVVAGRNDASALREKSLLHARATFAHRIELGVRMRNWKEVRTDCSTAVVHSLAYFSALVEEGEFWS